MTYTHETTGDLTAFTYFKDADGFIYYASGDNNLNNETVRSVLVYAPGEGDAAVRYQPESDTQYVKSLSHGYQSELPRLQDTLSPEQYTKIADKFVQDSVSSDEFLAVPTSGITEVYDPKQAFGALLTGNHTMYSSEASKRVQEAAAAFESKGIASERLGLYGGLQCSLIHTDGKEINDIDLLVDGLDAYDAMIALAQNNVVRPETFPAFIANNAIKRSVAIRRGQLSQFRLTQHPDTVVDIRLVRTDHDDTRTAQQLASLHLGGTIDLQTATVTHAHEALSTPARFEVQTTRGKQISVITNQYHHLGAAGVGDTVTLRGRATDQHTIALTDPNNHYIYPANAA